MLELFAQRGIPLGLHGADRLIAACARNDSEAVRSIAAEDERLVNEVVAEGGQRLAEFAGNGNTEGVGQLLDIGVGVQALHLHVAAWRARHSTVKLLIQRGALVNEPDGEGRTPLALAVRACVDSHWTHRRSPEPVEALLRAGASVRGVSFPCGYAEVDELLKSHGAGA